jgi:hypothetical protein
MRKREIGKNLKQYFNVKSKFLGDYDFKVDGNTKSYYIKVLNITDNHQVTINSKLIWSLKKGKIKGIKFNTISSELLNLKEFNKLENKIIIMTNKPYKLLKALNESDLKDISDEKIVNNIFITSDFIELIEHIK